MFDLKLYKSFLEKKNTRPLYSCMWEPMINPSATIISRASADGTLSARDVYPEDILSIADIVMKTASDIKGDLPFAIQASGGHQWLEAICGCNIKASKEQIWASPPEKNTADDFIAVSLSTDWEEILLHCHKAIIDYSKNRCFAAVPVLHGPIDILCSFMGTMELAYAVIEEPEKLGAALKKAGDIFLDVSKKLIKMLERYKSGYCGRMYMYTDKACVTLQNDGSYLMSPQVFKDLLEPVERKIISSLPCTVYHMHNSSLHLLDIIADYDMPAIQVSVDTNGPPMDKQIEVYEKIKKKTPLVLSCWSIEDMDLLRQNLSPQGLALTYIPAPDGCQINSGGSFDDFGKWQDAYENRTS